MSETRYGFINRVYPYPMTSPFPPSPLQYYRGKNVLVTGGCGLIGGFVVELLLASGARVTVADNLSRKHVRSTEDTQQEVRFLNIDLSQSANCLLACEGQDIVLNLAGKVTGILFNQTRHAEMFSANMALQQNVLEAAVQTGVKRFLQVSTACVYPHDAPVPTPEEYGEVGEPEPTNLGYGWAKRMGERLARFHASESGMEVAIVRPFNAYGLRDNFDAATSHVIPALIQRVLSGQDPLVVYGSGNQSRSFVHARDVARGMLLVTEKYTRATPVNIGHKEEVSIRELVNMILKITGRAPRVIYDTTQPDGYKRRAAEISLLREATGGWTPETKLVDGVAELVEWFRSSLKL